MCGRIRRLELAVLVITETAALHCDIVGPKLPIQGKFPIYIFRTRSAITDLEIADPCYPCQGSMQSRLETDKHPAMDVDAL